MFLPLVLPALNSALQIYDQMDSLPKTSYFGRTKSGAQAELVQTIDKVILALKSSVAVNSREEIKTLKQKKKTSRELQAEARERLISAPSKDSLSGVQKVWTTTREDCEQTIADEDRKLSAIDQNLARCTVEFCTQLPQIGIQTSEDAIESLLTPVTQDDLVSMAAVVTNIVSLTAEMEKLADESKELSSQATKYYGMYLLLVRCIDRMHERFIQEIEQVCLPKLQAFEAEAIKNIDSARNLLKRGDSKNVLMANIEANKTIIDACRCFAKTLSDHKDAILQENKRIKRMIEVAANTYETIKLGTSLGNLIGDYRSAFRALSQVQLPPLRPIQDPRLKRELQTLTERMLNDK